MKMLDCLVQDSAVICFDLNDRIYEMQDQFHHLDCFIMCYLLSPWKMNTVVGGKCVARCTNLHVRIVSIEMRCWLFFWLNNKIYRRRHNSGLLVFTIHRTREIYTVRVFDDGFFLSTYFFHLHNDCTLAFLALCTRNEHFAKPTSPSNKKSIIFALLPCFVLFGSCFSLYFCVLFVVFVIVNQTHLQFEISK